MRLLLQDVCKSYRRRSIVNNMTLSVHQGEIVGLLGPNGAGKTTTFYLATGLERPDQGRVWLGSRDITRLPMHRRARLGMSYLAQEASIFRDLTVRDNLLLVMEQTQVPRQQWHQRVENLLTEFQLHGVASTLGQAVSGGERRRTELARALAAGSNGPDFLLLDEPFAGVDPIAVADIQTVMRRLRDRNLGILITDHNVRETLAITDRAYIMREGYILASGKPEELYRHPQVRQYYLGESFQR
ncbi:Lipopolysaccharide export system ATP-binding protein LptB [Acaryochloris thomasi RCC1774]|uniref:Lipopolysaccharide export system ATP-binding protein LptB n=1 Tax=Acaryochloris thomasi RCC1774 TaxID=1764569 RepID=A0A2W1K3R4_9CYAN|nr:LPS export ABC transporter ATP-binding protein [Acaryochloris thomasi]PZD74731.1 Lipopolysaccharide export system ATP-binding protein LptB [Acaryochloris thomasi RCC1774]